MKKYYFIFLYVILYNISYINLKSIFDYSHLKGEQLDILAGSLSSKKNIIPYGYTKLNICHSQKVAKAEDTLGEILTGEVLYTTNYIAKTNEDQFCQILCYNNFSEKSVNLIQKLITRKYFTNWIVDKLPAGLIIFNLETKKTSIQYFNGIPLGYNKEGVYYIYNHLQFHILLNKIEEDKFNVVGFNILPLSIKHKDNIQICAKELNNILNNFNLENQPLEPGNILFTYDVIFEYSQTTLASRWDNYKTSKSSIHWTGIIISEVIIFSISVIIIIILCRNLRAEINSYNYRISQLQEINEYDWKQLSGDVFRPPYANSLLLSSILGTGTQLFLMVSATLFFGLFGFMNPEKRQNILNIAILFFCLMGLPGGYISTIFYKFWGGTNWIKVSWITSLLFPGVLIFGYIIVNIVLTIEKSNAAVHFYDILSLFILWIFCTLPLILIGSFFGAKRRKMIAPCDINRIPSEIPKKPCYLHYKYIIFITGFFGFSTIFIELNYVMASLWQHEIYFLATFLWISFFLFIIVVGEMSILFIYLNLCSGDYNWCWNSFFMGSSPVLYLIIYSIYYSFYLNITRLSAMVVYYGIMGLICAMLLFICGTISVFFNFIFLKLIYSKIKID